MAIGLIWPRICHMGVGDVSPFFITPILLLLEINRIYGLSPLFCLFFLFCLFLSFIKQHLEKKGRKCDVVNGLIPYFLSILRFLVIFLYTFGRTMNYATCTAIYAKLSSIIIIKVATTTITAPNNVSTINGGSDNSNTTQHLCMNWDIIEHEWSEQEKSTK